MPKIRLGQNQAACGRLAADYIIRAAKSCLAGDLAAMVTAPISKKALQLAGIDFPGHTEMLADLAGTSEPIMLLYAPGMAVSFVTTHQALRSVAESLSPGKIIKAAKYLHRFLKKVRGLKRPRIAVLGLNPHAGEDGLFGDEEIKIVQPAIEKLCSQGVDAQGPLPADTAFTKRALEQFDGHVALYHDQGGIPFKMFAFEHGVNVTLGSKLIRTSPDHGTAFDIAWQGKADPSSFFSAYDLAVTLAGKGLKSVGSRDAR